jgi:hypothetical protein
MHQEQQAPFRQEVWSTEINIFNWYNIILEWLENSQDKLRRLSFPILDKMEFGIRENPWKSRRGK